MSENASVKIPYLEFQALKAELKEAKKDKWELMHLIVTFKEREETKEEFLSRTQCHTMHYSWCEYCDNTY